MFTPYTMCWGRGSLLFVGTARSTGGRLSSGQNSQFLTTVQIWFRQVYRCAYYVPASYHPPPPHRALPVARSELVGWSWLGHLYPPAASLVYPQAAHPLKPQIRGAVKTCAPSFQRQGLARGPKGLHTRLLRPLHSPCGSAARLGGSRVSARRGARAVSRGIVDSPLWDPGTAGPTRDRGRPEWLVVDPQGSSAGPGRARAAPRPGIIYGPTIDTSA